MFIFHQGIMRESHQAPLPAPPPPRSFSLQATPCPLHGLQESKLQSSKRHGHHMHRCSSEPTRGGASDLRSGSGRNNATRATRCSAVLRGAPVRRWIGPRDAGRMDNGGNRQGRMGPGRCLRKRVPDMLDSARDRTIQPKGAHVPASRIMSRLSVGSGGSGSGCCVLRLPSKLGRRTLSGDAKRVFHRRLRKRPQKKEAPLQTLSLQSVCFCDLPCACSENRSSA